MIGKKVTSYKIEKLIGEGGMGNVYLGVHETLGRKVAIKVLHDKLVNNENLRKRFKNEASALAHMQHPNIVAIYDYVENDEGLFLIMEYVEGRELDVYINTISGPINSDDAKMILGQVLDGFDYAHNQGVIHRDIKPSNILITNDKRVKILDFGIAKLLEGDMSLTKTGTRMGTVLYMSPEQVKGEEIDKRSDIYSLGVTLFQMITGQCPYDQKSTEFAVYNQIVSEPLPQVQDIYPGADKAFQALIDKATQKDKNNRFGSCNEFKAALNSGAAGEKTIIQPTAVVNTPPPAPKATPKQESSVSQEEPVIKKKKKGAALLLFIVPLVIIVVGLLIYQLGFNDENEAKEEIDDIEETDEYSSGYDYMTKLIDALDKEKIAMDYSSEDEVLDYFDIEDAYIDVDFDNYSYDESFAFDDFGYLNYVGANTYYDDEAQSEAEEDSKKIFDYLVEAFGDPYDYDTDFYEWDFGNYQISYNMYSDGYSFYVETPYEYEEYETTEYEEHGPVYEHEEPVYEEPEPQPDPDYEYEEDDDCVGDFYNVKSDLKDLFLSNIDLGNIKIGQSSPSDVSYYVGGDGLTLYKDYDGIWMDVEFTYSGGLLSGMDIDYYYDCDGALTLLEYDIEDIKDLIEDVLDFSGDYYDGDYEWPMYGQTLEQMNFDDGYGIYLSGNQ